MRGAGWTVCVAVVVAAVLAAGLAVSSDLATSSPSRSHVHGHPTGRHAVTTRLETERQCLATRTIRLPCYDPAQIERAYDLGPLFKRGIDGRGETIAIVDSFGSPTIRTDLGRFDSAFHLPAPPSFRVIQPAGAVPPYKGRTSTMVGWAGETTLDVEWAHAMAPGAAIVLVETPVSETEGTTGFPQIVTSENYVIDNHLADVISQSFGATEETFASAQSLVGLRSAILNAASQGITMVAAAGDTGVADFATATSRRHSTVPEVTWPASDPLVTAVGGTQLTLTSSGMRDAPDQAWNDTYDPTVNRFLFGTTKPHADATGGGLSSVFSRPSFQDGVAAVVGDHRGIPDISMSAACSGLVDTYQSFGGPTPPGWYYVCGTSEATPLFAGIVALADQLAGHPLGVINPAIYAMSAAGAPGIVHVTQGNNTVSFFQTGVEETVNGYDAGTGYSLVTGVGTVDAALFVPELVAAVKSTGTTVSYGYLTPAA